MKFVLLSAPRSGSTLLADLLNQSRRVRCFGEIAKLCYTRRLEDLDWISARTGMSPVQIREEQRQDPFCFVTRMIGTDSRPWVGFKLLYHHCRERNRKSFWDLVQHDNAWHIVHLTRSSILDLYVSLLKARVTGEWSQPAGSRLSDRCHEEPWAISLSPQRTVKFLGLCDRWKAQAQALARSHKSIVITYEALAHDPKATSNRILEYFEQPPLDHYVLSYCKQATRPLAETVKNYRQLQSALKATKWAYLVER